MENPGFLKKKYNNLHQSLEVESAAKRTEKRTNQKVEQSAEKQIQNYLDRFKEILKREDIQHKKQGIEALKKVLYKQLIIPSKEVPYRAFELEQDIAEQGGHGRPEITPEFKEAKIKEIQSGQRESLDYWMDYLTSDDAMYPDWAKYWVFRSVTGLASYDKERGEFTKRKKDTVKPFPMLHIGALARVIEAVQERQAIISQNLKKEERKEALKTFNDHLGDAKFAELLSTENFNKLYTYTLEQFDNLDWENLENIEGAWRIFKQGAEPDSLYESLQGFPLEWCTANNKETARTQLEGGDFHVYYSHDNNGIARIPRLAIRMHGKNQIAEVRGIEKKQHIDPFIQPVLDGKLQQFGQEGKEYLKKSEDMKRMTELSQKQKQGGDFSVEDLTFLYEIDNPIEGFGYKKDPRIEALKEKRNVIADYRKVYNLEGQSDMKLANELISQGQFKVLSNHLGELSDLDQRIALYLIEEKEAARVFENQSSFKVFDQQYLAEQLIERDNTRVLAAFLLYFKGLDSHIALTLIEKRRAAAVFYHLDAFNGIDQNELVDALIASGQYETYIEYHKELTEVDFTKRLYEIIKRGDVGIRPSLRAFREVDHNKLAQLLIESDMNLFIDSIDVFQHLNAVTVNMLIEKGYEFFINENRDVFEEALESNEM